jgi:hypothetical protein
MSNLSRSEINHRYYTKNKEKIDSTSKVRRDANPELFNARARDWYKANKGEKLREKRRLYERNKRIEDVNFRIAQNLRVRLRCALKNNSKLSSAVELLGISIEEFKNYLQDKFQPDMSWNNYGEWHIDHILPISKFDLTNLEGLKLACHYTNLQPLWAEDNLRKSDN